VLPCMEKNVAFDPVDVSLLSTGEAKDGNRDK